MTTTTIPTHFVPSQRTCVKRWDDICQFSGAPDLGDGIASRDALIEALGVADSAQVAALEARLVAEQDRVAREREELASMPDPFDRLNDERTAEVVRLAAFRKSPEGQNERQIELLARIVELLEAGR